MGATAILSSLTGGLMAASTGLGIESEKAQAKARTAALKERMRQEEDVSRENSIHNMEKINHTLAAQAAISAAQGGGMSGPVSANMISMADINEFAADENVNKMNEVFQKSAIESQIAATQSWAQAQEIETGVGGIAGMAKMATSYYVPEGSTNNKNLPEI